MSFPAQDIAKTGVVKIADEAGVDVKPPGVAGLAAHSLYLGRTRFAVLRVAAGW